MPGGGTASAGGPFPGAVTFPQPAATMASRHTSHGRQRIGRQDMRKTPLGGAAAERAIERAAERKAAIAIPPLGKIFAGAIG